jgi:amidophosphoribosyltransferase
MLAETGINCECGLFGIWGNNEAARLTYYGLHSLQHRGQDGAGIVVKNGDLLTRTRGKGLLTDVFTNELMENLQGTSAIGHVLYKIGKPDHAAIQPLLFNFDGVNLALCHNGALTNAPSMRKRLEDYGSIFQTQSNSEILAHMIKRNRQVNYIDRIRLALSQLIGGFAFLMLTQSEMVAARDPRGIRPLVLGKLGESFIIASETCALDTVGATFERDIAPGEIIVINDKGIKTAFYTSDRELAVCGMEYIYIARPDSNIQGVNVHTSRKNAGKILAKESPTKADVVIASPDTGISAAIGYAEAMDIPYEIGLIRNRYIGRTFIAPSQQMREQGVKMKLSAVRSIVEGKSVVLVEDSIVRGTTGRVIINLLRETGAKEVHMKVAAPMFKHPCFYGIDLPSPQELIAHKHTPKQVAKLLGVDSLAFISEQGLADAVGIPSDEKCRGMCLACFTGNYPLDLCDFK